MRKTHKVICLIILFLTALFSYCLNAGMTETVSKNLVTFFSVVFGFYMTSIAILYNSSYTKKLYKQIDDKEQKRGIHKLRDYLLASGYCSVSSIVSIIIFTLIASKSSSGNLKSRFHSLSIPLVNFSVDLDLLLTSIIFGIAAVNVFFILLLLNTILDGMTEQSKK